MDLTKCIYEHIKDTYYYGLFGDFNLVIDKSTGYFNATKLCLEGGKEYKKWVRLEKSRNMIEYYQESCGPDLARSFLYEVKLQNNDVLNKKVTGTYVPKELILDIASWVSIEFYDKCNKIVTAYFLKEAEEKLEEKDKELEAFKEEKDKEVQDLKEELEDTKEHALVLQELLVKDDPITRTQVIYIATTELYAKNNNFKPGGVDDNGKLKSRLSTYNTGRVQNDLFYYSDTFEVSNYHIIEAQLKNLLSRFRDKKQKEMYRLHYSDMRYIVEYLCKYDGEIVDEVNTRLTQFIANLNKRNLRPVVPPPTTAYLTSITHLKEDGTVNNITIQSNSLEESIKRYILALEPDIANITKKKVFDDLKIRKDRKRHTPILQQLLRELRPEVELFLKTI